MGRGILGIKPGHDGSVCLLDEGRLVFSYEAEKDSGRRHAILTGEALVEGLSSTSEVPAVIAISGWDKRFAATEEAVGAGYLGVAPDTIHRTRTKMLGQQVEIFSSSHERSHIMCALGMSPYPQGQPCYALVWEGVIGAFYRVDELSRVSKVGDVMLNPGAKYAFAYAIANQRHQAAFFGLFDPEAAGKLMALTGYSALQAPSSTEARLIKQLLEDTAGAIPEQTRSRWTALRSKKEFEWSELHNVGVENDSFKTFARKFSEELFDVFFRFAKEHLQPGYPLLIAGGCGLNCDWNTKWLDSGLFSGVFVPPCANDTGSAIGTAVDAQGTMTGNWKIDWDVYTGQDFHDDRTVVESDSLAVEEVSTQRVAELLARDYVLACARGRCEIGPRALGNRSLLAAPFKRETRDRLNAIKQREGFRPIAPVCLEEDASEHFSGPLPSPYMLYFQKVINPTLQAITHVDGTARAQTVNRIQNPFLTDLLQAFRDRTGAAVLCNTSFNFKGMGFINSASDVLKFLEKHDVDGAIVGEQLVLKKNAQARGRTEGANLDRVADVAAVAAF